MRNEKSYPNTTAETIVPIPFSPYNLVRDIPFDFYRGVFSPQVRICSPETDSFFGGYIEICIFPKVYQKFLIENCRQNIYFLYLSVHMFFFNLKCGHMLFVFKSSESLNVVS